MGITAPNKDLRPEEEAHQAAGEEIFQITGDGELTKFNNQVDAQNNRDELWPIFPADGFPGHG